MTETFLIAIGFFYTAACVFFTTICLAVLLYRKLFEWMVENTQVKETENAVRRD